MAENESTIPKPPLPDTAVFPAKEPSPKQERVSIAVSEENLAALMGPKATSRKPATPVPEAEVSPKLALLSQAQEKQPPEQQPPLPAAPPAGATGTGSTLALLAAIKENRAE